MRKRDFLVVDPKMLILHSDSQEYASEVNKAIASAAGTVSSFPFSGGALFALTADLFGLHRAVLSLCSEGWAFTTVCLLRTMLDLLLSAAVITENPQEAEYRGFKYTHFFLKSQPDINDLRTEAQKQIEESIRLLPRDHQEKARIFMFQERLRGYWYSPEFQNPRDILDKLGRLLSNDVRDLYNTFSSGAHGGFIGLRLFKDDPDRIDPNPRADPQKQFAALAASIRIFLETMNMRDSFENGNRFRRTFLDLVRRLIALRPEQRTE